MKNEVTTFAMILPSCMRYAARVEKEIENTARLRIQASAVVQFTVEQAEELCEKWNEDASFISRVNLLSSQKVKIYLLSGNDAIGLWNDLIGPETPDIKRQTGASYDVSSLMQSLMPKEIQIMGSTGLQITKKQKEKFVL